MKTFCVFLLAVALLLIAQRSIVRATPPSSYQSWTNNQSGEGIFRAFNVPLYSAHLTTPGPVFSFDEAPGAGLGSDAFGAINVYTDTGTEAITIRSDLGMTLLYNGSGRPGLTSYVGGRSEYALLWSPTFMSGAGLHIESNISNHSGVMEVGIGLASDSFFMGYAGGHGSNAILGSTNNITITPLSTLTLSPLAGSGVRCVQTDNAGVVTVAAAACGSGAGTVTSVAATNPLFITGGASPTPNVVGHGLIVSGDTVTSGQNLGVLTTGLLKGTVSAGVSTVSTAAAGTDYQAPLVACTDYVSLSCVSGATDLGGTNATPTVIGIKESGGQNLPIAGVSANTCLERNGANQIVGVACSAGGTVTSVTGTAQRILVTPSSPNPVVDTIGGFYSGAVSGGNENLGSLTTGLLKGTVTAGVNVITTGAAGTDYQAPIAGNTCGSNTFATQISTAGALTCTQPTIGNLANIAANTVVGNPTGSSAAPSALTLGGGLTNGGSSLTMSWCTAGEVLMSAGPGAAPTCANPGNDLSGAFPSPSVNGFVETSGPQDLKIGPIGTPGYVLVRDGSNQIVGSNPLNLPGAGRVWVDGTDAAFNSPDYLSSKLVSDGTIAIVPTGSHDQTLQVSVAPGAIPLLKLELCYYTTGLVYGGLTYGMDGSCSTNNGVYVPEWPLDFQANNVEMRWHLQVNSLSVGQTTTCEVQRNGVGIGATAITITPGTSLGVTTTTGTTGSTSTQDTYGVNCVASVTTGTLLLTAEMMLYTP